MVLNDSIQTVRQTHKNIQQAYTVVHVSIHANHHHTQNDLSALEPGPKVSYLNIPINCKISRPRLNDIFILISKNESIHVKVILSCRPLERGNKSFAISLFIQNTTLLNDACLAISQL